MRDWVKWKASSAGGAPATPGYFGCCRLKRARSKPSTAPSPDFRRPLRMSGSLAAKPGSRERRCAGGAAEDALDRDQRDTAVLGHRPAGPVGRLMRRLGAGERHPSRGDFRRNLRLADYEILPSSHQYHRFTSSQKPSHQLTGCGGLTHPTIK
jgi:hypothetical protein